VKFKNGFVGLWVLLLGCHFCKYSSFQRWFCEIHHANPITFLAFGSPQTSFKSVSQKWGFVEQMCLIPHSFSTTEFAN